LSRRERRRFQVLRLDGRDFHRLRGVKRPFDLDFALSFVKGSESVLKGSGASLAYLVSDETNLLFSGGVGSILSFDSIEYIIELFSSTFCKTIRPLLGGISPIFDWKVFDADLPGTASYLTERQEWAYNNFLRAYAFSIRVASNLTPSEARRSLSAESPSSLRDLLYSAGVDLEGKPLWQHRGILVKSKNLSTFDEKDSTDSVSTEMDLDLPLFQTEAGRSYLRRLLDPLNHSSSASAEISG